MRQCVRTAFRACVFLLAVMSLVHCLACASPAWAQPAAKQKGSSVKRQQSPAPVPQVRHDIGKLPAPVKEMREAILAAVRSGSIEDLRHAYELNELKPDLGVKPAGDVVAHWKQTSGDGEGREILAALAGILEAGYVELPLGADLENNRVYVWPYLAEVPLGMLTPAQEVDLLRLVPPAVAKEMKAKGKYAHWRLAIGADGTWHFFRKGE